jgi:beta-1,4-mannosyl-glycoprotein beta-1,4-N-acetylglucosaminyltransferase
MIIDCFIFYNELELLFYRLSILYDKVDYFVLVESTRTYTGVDKPLYFEQNKALFDNFKDKIIHVIIDDLKAEPLSKDEVWLNEYKQRNSIDIGIKRLNLKNDDLIIVSDVDEIINPEVIDRLQPNCSLEMDFYYYNLHTLNKNKWYYAKVIDYEFYKKRFASKPNSIRWNSKFSYVIKNSGWHLSYFGDEYFIQNKLKNFAHQEWNSDYYTDVNKIKERMEKSQDLFERQEEQWENIELSSNINLPYKYEDYLKKYV